MQHAQVALHVCAGSSAVYVDGAAVCGNSLACSADSSASCAVRSAFCTNCYAVCADSCAVCADSLAVFARCTAALFWQLCRMMTGAAAAVYPPPRCPTGARACSDERQRKHRAGRCSCTWAPRQRWRRWPWLECGSSGVCGCLLCAVGATAAGFAAEAGGSLLKHRVVKVVDTVDRYAAILL